MASRTVSGPKSVEVRRETAVDVFHRYDVKHMRQKWVSISFAPEVLDELGRHSRAYQLLRKLDVAARSRRSSSIRRSGSSRQMAPRTRAKAGAIGASR